MTAWTRRQESQVTLHRLLVAGLDNQPRCKFLPRQYHNETDPIGSPFLYRKGDGEDIEYPKNNRSSLTPGTVTRVSRELVSQITTLDSPLGMRKPTARFKSLPPSPFL